MKSFWVSLIAVSAVAMFILAPSRSIAQSDKKETSLSFDGIWEGKMNDLPGIDLKIEEAKGKISGVIVFYFQERSDANAPWHVVSENPMPLLAPHVEGNTLTFEVQHHKCHTCSEFGPNVKFRMEIVGPNEARLWKLENEAEEKNKDLGPGLKLVQRTETPAEYSAKRMADGKEWTTQNLDLNTVPSYCYEDADLNCRRYGRLYTWDSAQRVCQSLGDGWRLPTDDEWRQIAKHYGGVSEDSDDKGRAAYKALLAGGSSGFNAVLGGGRSDDGQYARKEAHGFYWTSSEIDPANGWFYNFAAGGQALHRQNGGEKQQAFSVRCLRE